MPAADVARAVDPERIERLTLELARVPRPTRLGAGGLAAVRGLPALRRRAVGIDGELRDSPSGAVRLTARGRHGSSTSQVRESLCGRGVRGAAALVAGVGGWDQPVVGLGLAFRCVWIRRGHPGAAAA
jgi:hypothetical protein